MGSSESKLSAVSTPKQEPIVRPKHERLTKLADPRSPSTGIDRTPIQMPGAESKKGLEESVTCTTAAIDPRSPTHGISRTPLKESMRVTVSSFARRLGMLFLNEANVDEATPSHHVAFIKHLDLPVDELGPSEPLLSHNVNQGSRDVEYSSTTPQTDTPSQGYGSLVSSPFVLVGEVEVQTDLSLSEAEDALMAEPPTPHLRRELSLSLLTCHNGMHPSQDGEDVVTPSVKINSPKLGDHDYAQTVVCAELHPCQPLSVSPTPADEGSPDPKGSELEAAAEVPEPPCSLSRSPRQSVEVPAISAPAQSAESLVQAAPTQTAIRCPKFDAMSPSQVVFKPQWLGVGFGATGLKPRGGPGRGKANSSPLASRKPSENEGCRVKPKQRGKVLASEGRSPLHILRETNSPRENSQMKLKISTPDKQRLGGQLDRRVLVHSLNKENQR